MATKKAIISLGIAIRKFFLKDPEDLRLKTMYLSILKIIKAHKKDNKTMIKWESKIKDKPKKEDIKAKKAVKKIVAPIL